jgi:hypothetical protein
MSKFGSTRGFGPPTMQNVINNIWVYCHNLPIGSIEMDPAGNLKVNGEYIKNGNSLIAGYTVMSHDMPKGKLLLRKDR